jgi:hypothetical protein
LGLCSRRWAIRGANNILISSGSGGAVADSNILNSFDSDGFTLGNQDQLNDTGDTYVAWNWKAGGSAPSKTYAVTVVSDSGNKYRFDGFGTSAVTLDLQEGGTYKFDQSHSSNSGHPFRFGTSSNAYDYSTGVTTSGTPGNAGAYTQITVAASAPALYYACSSHSGMGGAANTNSTSGSSNFSGTIQSNLSANVDAGFSIISYTGAGGSNAGKTVGHGLSAKPDLIIIKIRPDNYTGKVYNSISGAEKYFDWASTAALGDYTQHWNDTEPTSSVFS